MRSITRDMRARRYVFLGVAGASLVALAGTELGASVRPKGSAEFFNYDPTEKELNGG